MDEHGPRLTPYVVWRLLWRRYTFRVLSAIVVLAACGLLFGFGYFPSRAGSSVITQTRKHKNPDGPTIHVCISSDDTDLRAAAVLIRSAIESAADPDRLVFHFITTLQYAPIFNDLFGQYLGEVRVQMYSNHLLQAQIEQNVGYRFINGRWKSPVSTFEFVPFYLTSFLNDSPFVNSDSRLIFLKTDIAVLGDLGELYDMDLQGSATALVKVCSQHYDDFINFEEMKPLGFTSYNPKACMLDHSVLVIDQARWSAQNITGRVEMWMDRFRNSDSDLWEPKAYAKVAFNLAIADDYVELGEEWHCDGLGREAMTLSESRMLRKSGFDHKTLNRLGVNLSDYGSILPYVATCSATSKLLHFGGSMKPWLASSFEQRAPVCAMPQSFSDYPWSWTRSVKIFCDTMRFVNCTEIWSAYIDPVAECALKDFDKEWRDDEGQWGARKRTGQPESREVQDPVLRLTLERAGESEARLIRLSKEYTKRAQQELLQERKAWQAKDDELKAEEQLAKLTVGKPAQEVAAGPSTDESVKALFEKLDIF